MSKTNEASPASVTSDVERVVKCANGVCGACDWWEPLDGGVGYCSMFNKRTEYAHGEGCTGYERI